MSFTPEDIIGSCHEQENKKIFMSSPVRADGYDTPAQQREDSTTFELVALEQPGGPGPGQPTLLSKTSTLRTHVTMDLHRFARMMNASGYRGSLHCPL